MYNVHIYYIVNETCGCEVNAAPCSLGACLSLNIIIYCAYFTTLLNDKPHIIFSIQLKRNAVAFRCLLRTGRTSVRTNIVCWWCSSYSWQRRPDSAAEERRRRYEMKTKKEEAQQNRCVHSSVKYIFLEQSEREEEERNYQESVVRVSKKKMRRVVSTKLQAAWSMFA